MRKWIIAFVLLTLGLIGYHYFQTEGPQTSESRLTHFVMSGLSSPKGGIYTNYLPTNQELAVATGHEVLSESLGLMMLATYYGGDAKVFKKYSNYLEDNMLLEDGTYAWRISETSNQALSANASIDDLRIGRAYLLAYQLWKDDAYRLNAQGISTSLLENGVKDNLLLNYNHGDALVDLSYLDLYTMSLYESLDSNWREIKRTSLQVLTNGYLGDKFPFYHKVYDNDSKAYVQEQSINMIDALLVVLHLSEEGRANENSIIWLKNQLAKGPVYGHYRSGDWTPVDGEESTAVYALIMRIAYNINDEDLYARAKERALKFQVLNEASAIDGAFAFETTLEVYSFDQLQMLVALRRGYEK